MVRHSHVASGKDASTSQARDRTPNDKHHRRRCCSTNYGSDGENEIGPKIDCLGWVEGVKLAEEQNRRSARKNTASYENLGLPSRCINTYYAMPYHATSPIALKSSVMTGASVVTQLVSFGSIVNSVLNEFSKAMYLHIPKQNLRE